MKLRKKKFNNPSFFKQREGVGGHEKQISMGVA